MAQGTQIKGVRLGCAGAGIKRQDRDDLVLIEIAPQSSCAGVFTRNAFCAAPVIVARDHLEHSPRWLLINAGNANAGTGIRGIADAGRCCSAVAGLFGGHAEDVLPFSTGVIGEFLPVEKIEAALSLAISDLRSDGWERASRAIMTTDTKPKLVHKTVRLNEREISITGIAKGAGMIHPNMATMLAFVATDAPIAKRSLQTMLNDAVDHSFNCITIDGDTSTNDACILIATGMAGGGLIDNGSLDFFTFNEALQAVLASLAEMIVRDGEGATKFIRITVNQARNEAEARTVGKTVALSPLVKTAFFASDPNWGRILAAVGRAGCCDLDINGVSIWLGDVCIVENGARCVSYNEADGQAVMNAETIDIRIDLGRGSASQRVLTCDFSYDYVRINAEYRT